MDVVDAFNTAEAGLWIVFAVLTALFGRRVRGLTPGLIVSFAVSFLAFGASDLMELRTGAWWRPPSLLIFKGICLLGIVSSSLQLWRNRRLLARA